MTLACGSEQRDFAASSESSREDPNAINSRDEQPAGSPEGEDRDASASNLPSSEDANESEVDDGNPMSGGAGPNASSEEAAATNGGAANNNGIGDGAENAGETRGETAGTAGSGGTIAEQALKCDPGWYSDPDAERCILCEQGYFDDDSDAATPCVQHTVCGAGEHVVRPGNYTTDQECEACVGGYTTEENQDACFPWQPCLGAEIAEGTATAPKTCSPVAALAAGRLHRCALLANGTVSCWGDNSFSQLGIRGISSRNYGQVIEGLSNVQSIYAGSDHTCALLEDGTVKCWGRNDYGQLGAGTFTESEANPVTVEGISDVVALAAGDSTTCGIVRAGTAACWGANQFAQLGNGEYEDSAIPVSVVGVSGIQKIATQLSRTCALLDSGQLFCVGRDVIAGNGELTNTDAFIEIQLPGGQGAEDVVASAGGMTCILLGGATTLACWGPNNMYQVGPFEASEINEPVVYPETLGTIDELRIGSGDTCVRQGGALTCFGSGQLNYEGQTANGTLSEIPEVNDAQTFTLGQGGGCYLDRDGVPYCWGYNSSGQVGKGIESGIELLPIRVSGGPVASWP